MEYSQILLEMLERIKVLENKVKALEEKNNVEPEPQQQQAKQLNKVSAKYRGLAEYLLSVTESKVTLSYSQIEEILGFELPDTAKKYKNSFWANTESHSYASSWLSVGFTTRVDTDSDKITFVKNLL